MKQMKAIKWIKRVFDASLRIDVIRIQIALMVIWIEGDWDCSREGSHHMILFFTNLVIVRYFAKNLMRIATWASLMQSDKRQIELLKAKC